MVVVLGFLFLVGVGGLVGDEVWEVVVVWVLLIWLLGFGLVVVFLVLVECVLVVEFGLDIYCLSGGGVGVWV